MLKNFVRYGQPNELIIMGLNNFIQKYRLKGRKSAKSNENCNANTASSSQNNQNIQNKIAKKPSEKLLSLSPQSKNNSSVNPIQPLSTKNKIIKSESKTLDFKRHSTKTDLETHLNRVDFESSCGIVKNFQHNKNVVKNLNFSSIKKGAGSLLHTQQESRKKSENNNSNNVEVPTTPSTIESSAQDPNFEVEISDYVHKSEISTAQSPMTNTKKAKGYFKSKATRLASAVNLKKTNSRFSLAAASDRDLSVSCMSEASSSLNLQGFGNNNLALSKDGDRSTSRDINSTSGIGWSLKNLEFFLV